MIEVGLFDGSFRGQASATLDGENAGLGPKYIKWVRDERRSVNVYTDMHIKDVVEAYSPHNVAWIIEPDWLLNGENAEVVKSKFRTIFTSNLGYAETYDEFHYVPTGGSWIDLDSWCIPPKITPISMMTTDKQKAPGHRFRTEIAKKIYRNEMPVTFYGRGSFPIESKFTALGDYMFSIVVESHKIRGYFTEKLIDCFALGVFPIYWGDPSIGDRFCEGGISTFNSMDGLFNILTIVLENPVGIWNQALPYMRLNQKLARRYVCAEDWMFEEYPNEFT